VLDGASSFGTLPERDIAAAAMDISSTDRVRPCRTFAVERDMISALGKLAGLKSGEETAPEAAAAAEPAAPLPAEAVADLPPVPAELPPVPAAPPSESLEQFGREHEAMRADCAGLMQRMELLSGFGSDLAALFRRFDRTLEGFEQTKTRLNQREAVLGMLQADHAKLKDSQSELAAISEKDKADLAGLRADAEQMRQRAAQQGERIEKLEADLGSSNEALIAATGKLQAAEKQNGYLEEEIAAFRAEIERNDALIAQLQAETGDLRHRAQQGEEAARSTQIALQDSQHNAARLVVELEASRMAQEAERQRADAAEGEVAATRAELAQTRSDMQRDVDMLRVSGAELTAQVEQFVTLREANERAHAETRQELQAKLAELRQEERRVRELQANLSVAEKKLKSEVDNNSELAARLAESESHRATLVSQIKPLLKNIRERNDEVDSLQASLDAANARHGAEAQKAAAEQARLEALVAELTARLEDERTRRTIAEGALEEDRRARIELQLAVSNARLGPGAPPPAPLPRRPGAGRGKASIAAAE
jgi:chromosome segregation ATPase